MTENPEILSPSALLTLKTLTSDLGPIGDLDIKSLYKEQWKQVQYLANKFWFRWRQEYLQSLQKRPKWNFDQNPLEAGDIVLLKDKEVVRNCWPMGRVTQTFSSEDGRIRKAEVLVIKDGKQTTYTRPVVDLVLLVRHD